MNYLLVNKGKERKLMRFVLPCPKDLINLPFKARCRDHYATDNVLCDSTNGAWSQQESLSPNTREKILGVHYIFPMRMEKWRRVILSGYTGITRPIAGCVLSPPFSLLHSLPVDVLDSFSSWLCGDKGCLKYILFL